MLIHLDPLKDGFLGDHRVDGVPLLPTVMAVDLMARAALAGGPHARVALADGLEARVAEIRDLQVGPPVLFDGDQGREIEVLAVRDAATGPGPSFACRLRHAGHPSPHFGGRVVLTHSAPPVRESRPQSPLDARHPRSPLDVGPSLGAGDIYPPYFHGPAFRVIDGANWSGGFVVARLATGLPGLQWSSGPPVTVPALRELCLQASGLWDLATSGRMMIPAGVDQVVMNVALNYRPADASLPIEARVRPRTSAAGRTTFDGEVADGWGRILLVMRGYRTADLGATVGADQAGRIRLAFDRDAAATAGRR